MIGATFDCTKTPLDDLLKYADNGKLQLPENNSVINKMALAARTIRQNCGRAPSKYLPTIEKATGVAKRMDEVLRSHCIAPGDMRADRFWEFYAARAEVLLRRIEAATGKSITREPELFRVGVVAEAYDEGPEEWDADESLEAAAP